MQKILTTHLLEILISKGYRYCLSRTTTILGEDASHCITLLPLKYPPSLNQLPENFDAFFKIGEEPRQMALGVDETIILVDLTGITTYAILN